jgi:uncharacterized protein (DUF305 family)
MRHVQMRRAARLAPSIAAATLAAACAGAGAVPAPATTASAAPAAASAAATPRPPANAADVRFMQQMLGHHAQALVMTALVPSHGRDPAVRLLAERVTVSQRDEMGLMRRWLADRGAPVPDPDDEHAGHDMGAGHDGAMPRMPGMLTPAELARLGQATGPAFDRLFLSSMIRHHEGALAMVAAFFGTRGAGQDAEIFRFASDVDADQRAEIRRMRAMLGAS